MLTLIDPDRLPYRPSPTNHGPSFIRWAGSKRKSLPELSAVFRDRDRHYVEPFAGSAALFFATKPHRATLADLNAHLINTLRQVRDNPHSVHSKLLQMSRSKEEYYERRNLFNDLRPYGIRSAVLFLYLNRNCFNGLWRTNQRGRFNVPFGAEVAANPPLELLISCAAALKCARLRHQDFRKTLSDVDRNSFIYADPPYFNSAERTFIEYGRRSFGRSDLFDLIECLKTAERKGAQIALTYCRSMPIDGIPRHWSQRAFDITRNVGGFSGSRKVHAEVLYTNFI